jgi:hypothetical protein
MTAPVWFGVTYDHARLTPLGWVLWIIHMCITVGCLLVFSLGKSKTLSIVLFCLIFVFGWLVWILNERGFAVHKTLPENEQH